MAVNSINFSNPYLNYSRCYNGQETKKGTNSPVDKDLDLDLDRDLDLDLDRDLDLDLDLDKDLDKGHFCAIA